MRNLLVISSLVSFAAALSLVEDAGAAPYHFSGAACQAELPADAQWAWNTGAGISNTNTQAFGPTITAVCPVTGLESSTQTQTELRARLWDGNGALGIGGFWQVDLTGLGTLYWSSIKYACASANGCASPTTFQGGGTVRWTGSELYQFPFSGFTTYSFRALIPPRCYDTACYSSSWVQSYGVTHNER